MQKPKSIGERAPPRAMGIWIATCVGLAAVTAMALRVGRSFLLERGTGWFALAWTSLHRSIYVAALLAASHALLGPHSSDAPLVALALIALLLVLRLVPRRVPTLASTDR